jgi:alpha-ketoglutarate-dependent taurine dioxygenase
VLQENMTVEAPIRETSYSIEQFVRELSEIDFVKDPRPKIFRKVNFSIPEFTDSVTENGFAIVHSSDGTVSHVIESQSEGLDNSHASGYFGFHTDGQYLPHVPHLVILHCKEEGDGDIPTIFSDSNDIIEILRIYNKLHEAHEYEFVFKDRHGIEHTRPILEPHVLTGEAVMNIALGSAQCRLQPVSGSIKTEAEANDFYQLLSEIAARIPSHLHTWQKGDTIVFDNQRLLHARGYPQSEKKSGAKRHLYRIWLNKK